MVNENKTYPVNLEHCLKLIDYDPAIVRKMDNNQAQNVYDFVELIRHDLEEILLDDIKNIDSIRLVTNKFEQWNGFYGSTIHSHLYAYVSALETEIDNDQIKGETLARICEDLRKMRLIMDIMQK